MCIRDRDYVLPSTGFNLLGSGVFWPLAQSPEAAIADGSDHHLVWVCLLYTSRCV